MNTNFMRLLALRLERLSLTQVLPEECRIVEHFDSMDGFFMSSDLKFWNRPPGFIFGGEDWFIGGIEEWAVQVIQEQGGYYSENDEDDELSGNWVDVQLDDEFSEQDVWELACRALGLGRQGDTEAFVPDEGQAHALLHPACLYGRMQDVTPRMTAEVLRRAVEGLWPEAAWRWVDEDLRKSRLIELANIVERTEAGVPLTKVDEWSHGELEENLTNFSMQSRGAPWAMESGAWCGDLAMWVYKLWGANAHLWFGPEAGQNLSLVSSTLLGLTGMQGLTLFEATVSSRIKGDLDTEAWRKELTPVMASEVLRQVARGVFPSVVWDDLYRRQSLEALLDGGITGGMRGE